MDAEHTVFHDVADFGQGLVLDLADALLGHADDFADFFQGQRGCLFLLPVEAAADDGLLDRGQIGQIAIDDGFELVDAVLFDLIAAFVGPVALLPFRARIRRGSGVRCRRPSSRSG